MILWCSCFQNPLKNRALGLWHIERQKEGGNVGGTMSAMGCWGRVCPVFPICCIMLRKYFDTNKYTRTHMYAYEHIELYELVKLQLDNLLGLHTWFTSCYGCTNLWEFYPSCYQLYWDYHLFWFFMLSLAIYKHNYIYWYNVQSVGKNQRNALKINRHNFTSLDC